MKIIAIQRNVRIGALENFGFPADMRLDPLGEFGLKEVDFDDKSLLEDPQIISCIENGIIAISYDEPEVVKVEPTIETVIETVIESTETESTESEGTSEVTESSESADSQELGLGGVVDLAEWEKLSNKEATEKIKTETDLSVLGALSERGKTKSVKSAAHNRVAELLKS